MKKFDISYLLLSMQRALLGSVIPELRAVTVDLNNQTKIVYINFYYNCKISNEIYDLSSCVVTEVLADFPPDYLNDIEQNIFQLNHPKKISSKGKLAYLRKE